MKPLEHVDKETSQVDKGHRHQSLVYLVIVGSAGKNSKDVRHKKYCYLKSMAQDKVRCRATSNQPINL